jgi:thymidylate synthase
MHIKTRNVNTAFETVVSSIAAGDIPTIRTPSRNGPVIQIPDPIIITYTNPRERVLFNPARDANPFFHLYESLWMLAGRNDVAPLKYYASKIDQFSDDGETFNGAYGYRWRHAQVPDHQNWENGDGVDQLDIIIDHLKRKPESRRVVLQMWNVEDDLMKIDDSKDVCCNTAAYFSIRRAFEVQGAAGDPWNPEVQSYLDMTVTNRSNDLIWGMFGANAVHFSFLQEYVACALGVEVGHYHQMSNNAHVYTETNSGWHPEKWLEDHKKNRTMYSPPLLSYGVIQPTSVLFRENERELFDQECSSVVGNNVKEDDVNFELGRPSFKIEFFESTVQPALNAYHYYKVGDFGMALSWCDAIRGSDWRLACRQWIQRRKENRDKKVQTES